MNRKQKQILSSLVVQPVEWDSDLSAYTSIGIGGPAGALATVNSIQELEAVLSFVFVEEIDWRIIGRGTNLLVSDKGFSGLIVVLGSGFRSIAPVVSSSADSNLIKVGGACGFGKLIHHCINYGLTGAEFGCGIPGTIGGAVIMNAGAWGAELADIIHSVTVIDHRGRTRIPRTKLTFSYRKWDDFDTLLARAVVAEVELTLVQGDPLEIKRHCRSLLDKRKAIQPTSHPNAGSFFKNPPGDSAGRLIEKSGLKGKSIGGAMVSKKHANFLINKGGATATDMVRLMTLIQKRVKDISGIELDPEVHLL